MISWTEQRPLNAAADWRCCPPVSYRQLTALRVQLRRAALRVDDVVRLDAWREGPKLAMRQLL